MMLAIDAGNTRWKWGIYNSAGLCVEGVVTQQYTDQFQLALQKSLTEVAESEENPIGKVLVASVAGAQRNSQILQVCKNLLRADVEFIRVQKQLAGLTAAYKNLDNLGVDRWLAVLAAWNDYACPCVVIDAGSAITVDYVAGGQHQGGLIVPGLGLMQRALFNDTAQIKLEALAPPANWLPQNDTLPCVEHGLAAMLKGFVQQVIGRHRQVKIVLTGGDAGLIASYIDSACETRPTLVLDGINVFYQASAQ